MMAGSNVVLRAGAALAVAGATCVTYGVVVERRWFALRHETIPVLHPAAGGRPLRVLHLSDLHLLPGQRAVRRFLQRCADSAPDLVVVTGDLLGDPDVIDDAVALLASVRRDRPGLVVLGSNDRYGPTPKHPLRYFTDPEDRTYGARLDTARLLAGLRATGWQVLCNQRVEVTTAAGVLDVVGLDDPHIGRDEPAAIDWTLPSAPVALRLGLVHAPYLRALSVFDLHGFDLVLSGHTHGGQVRLPGVGALTANCDLPRRQARGLSRLSAGGLARLSAGGLARLSAGGLARLSVGGLARLSAGGLARLSADRFLHVSAGLGHARYAPFRFCCRPEATVLDLVPA